MIHSVFHCLCATQAPLFDEPLQDSPSRRRLEESQLVVVLQCSELFAQVYIPSDNTKGWIRKETLFIFSPPYISPGRPVQHIVRLSGACSVGKSSFENAVVRQGTNWVVFDDDDVIYSVVLQAIRQRFPREYSVLCEGIEEDNLYMAILRKLVCFKRQTPQEKRDDILSLLETMRKELDDPRTLDKWKQGIRQSLRARETDDIRRALFEGKNLLVADSSGTMDMLEELAQPSKVVKVLLYSSFQISFQRIIDRNAAAEESGTFELKRYFSFLPSSYCRLMKLVPKAAQACDTVPRREMEAVFDRIVERLEFVRPDAVPHSFTQYDFPEKVLRTWQKELLSPQGENQEVCHLTPKKKYDVILRGDRASPEQLSHSLLEMLAQRDQLL